MAVKASATTTLSFMVDVKAVYRYYKLQASTASAPSAPTTTPASTPSGWTDVEPAYTEGSTNTLYFVDGTLFADNTFSYSAVSKSSSYEAAKIAYNKAVTANNAVSALETRVATVERETTTDAIIDTVKESNQFQAAGDYVTGTSAYSQLKQTVSGLNSTVQSHTGSISNLQQTAEGIQVRLDNQQTVRNLVSKSRLLDGWEHVVSAGVTVSKNVSTSAPEFGEVTIARFNASTANSSDQSSYIHMTNAARVTSGSKYTLSVWARKVSGGNARPRLALTTTNQSAIIAENLTTEWKRYSYTFTLGTISTSGKYVDIATSFGVSVLAGQTGVFEICCPQLEAGDTMNPWSANSIDSTDYMSFTSQGLIVGDMTKEKLGRNVCINDGGVHVFYEGSTEDVNEIAHLGYGEGNAESGIAEAPYYTFGTRKADSAVGNYSVAEGTNNTASALCSHAEGYLATASGTNAHAEGSGTTASGGASHAEGGQTTASNDVAHAEGSLTVASGWTSHAEGYETKAKGEASHAEGRESQASGLNSHASGLNTRASSDNQTAIGKYNVEDTAGKYAFIVGNGTSTSNRSNAFTVDWNGNVEASASVGATGSITSGDMCYVTHGKANTDAMTKTTRTDTGRSVSFGVGAGGTNAGVYDNNKSKWLLYANNDNTYLNGACVDVTSSSTASTFFTLNSTNVTSIESAYVARWGEVCMVYVSVKMKVSLSAGDISNKVIGTLKSGYRPKILAALASGATGPVCAFYANTSGEVSVVATHSSVNAGKTISFGGTFILA